MLKGIYLLHRQISETNKPLFLLRNSVSSSYHHQQQPLESAELGSTVESLNSISSNPCIHLLGLCRNVASLKKVHGLLTVHGLISGILCETKLVSLYGSFGYVCAARSVFDQIRNPDFYSWKVMIRWYFLNDLYLEVIRFYNCLRKCLVECDNAVFSIVLKACTERHDINEGRKLHCQIVKAGSPDSFVMTGLVDFYAKCEEIECAREVFDEIVDRNVVSWTSMISAYVQNDCFQEGLILFDRMREGVVEVNEFTFASVLTACTKLGALHQGKWIHGYVLKKGIGLNSHLVSALLDMYIKCGDIRDARSVFDDELSTIDLVSWTAMIVGYTQSGFPDEALKLFMTDQSTGLLPNSVTITSLLSACAQLENLNLGKSIHSLGIRFGLEDSSVRNALVDMYAKCYMIQDAHSMFETICTKDVVSWNSIISGYCQNGFAHEALHLFHQMRSDAFLPDAVTIVSILSACSSIGSLYVGSSVHAYSLKEGLLSTNIFVGTALLNFYAKCGDAKSARVVFDGMREKNTITWSAMIGGYGKHGDGSGSLALFGDMLKEQLEPNEVIFTTILSTCSHTGLVGEGWRYFISMCKDYNIVPSSKHYACMVDLLARAGRLEEAWDFILKMPIQPDVSLFGAFIHGCGLHTRFDLGVMAIRRMLELHPNEACYYVLMSNMYASDGRWNQVNEVRESMKQSGLSKFPGNSLVDKSTENDFCFSSLAAVA